VIPRSSRAHSDSLSQNGLHISPAEKAPLQLRVADILGDLPDQSPRVLASACCWLASAGFVGQLRHQGLYPPSEERHGAVLEHVERSLELVHGIGVPSEQASDTRQQ
jgi:hypothetical protein